MRSASSGLRIFSGKIIFSREGFCRQQKTALPKQSVKLHLKYNQRLENWGASLAGLRPARDA